MSPQTLQNNRINPFAAAISASLIWGLSPLYFKALETLSEGELLAQRILWALLSLLLLLTLTGNRGGLLTLLRDLRTLGWLLLSALFLGANWLSFIWGVAESRVLEISLGYFLFPLLNALFGALFLGERPGRRQRAAIGLALTGVTLYALQLDRPPWIALAIAGSFASYSLVRKRIDLPALQALALELGLLAPAAIGWLLWLGSAGRLSFGHGPALPDLLIITIGLVTVLPLLLYTHSMRGLSLTLTGLISYLAPLLNLLLAVAWFGEPLGAAELLCLGFIACALALLAPMPRRWRTRRAI